MDEQIERVRFLLSRGRYERAEAEVRSALMYDPHDPETLLLLALVLSHQDRVEEALEPAQQAVSLDPFMVYARYILSTILYRLGRLEESDRALNEALRLDPEDVTLLAALAARQIARQELDAALETAERGLNVDPQKGVLLYLKALALWSRGDNRQAWPVAERFLQLAPHDARAHSVVGHIQSALGNFAEAEEHYREALRLDPESLEAQEGLLDNIKRRSWLYQWLERYRNWVYRIGRWGRVGIYVGIAIAVVLQLFLLVLPLMFVNYSTWIIDPVFNLFLRFHPDGRHVLTDWERLTSTLVGGCLVLGLAALLAAAITGGQLLLFSGFWILSMALPVGGMAWCGSKRCIRWLGAYTLVLAALGVIALFSYAVDAANWATAGGSFVALWLLYGFLANRLIIRSHRAFD